MKTEWIDWFREQAQRPYIAEPANISDMVGWEKTMMEIDGQMIEVWMNPNAPYLIQVMKVSPPGRPPYYLPMPRRIPGRYEEGYVALPIDKHTQRYLLQVKQEQGNDPAYNYAVLGPAVQMSSYNYHRLHGDEAPQRAEWVQLVEHWYPIPQDGGMLIRKYNKVGFLEVEDVVLKENERFFTMQEIKDAIWFGLVGDHVLQALGMIKAFRG